MHEWKKTPHVFGRLSTEDDVRAGKAVFYVADDSATALQLPLPACAIHHDIASQEATPVVVIQAEKTLRGEFAGIRYLPGGNGICTLAELEILTKPDERFP
jgi:hypothetical protein